MPIKNRAVAAAWAGVLVSIVLIALPAALWWASGNPFAGDTWRKVADGWGTGLAPEITPTAVVQILAAICWVAWLLLAVSVVAEVVALAQGGTARRIRGMSFFQAMASMLLAPLALGLAALPAGAVGRVTTPLVSVRAGAPTAVAARESVERVGSASSTGDAAPGHYRVRLGDTLDRVAEELLGDPLRWRELWTLNRDRVMRDGRTFTKPTSLREGWDLRLPDGVVTDLPVAPATGSAGTGPASSPLSPSAPTWTVEHGQSLRRIAHLAYGVQGASDTIRVVSAIVHANGLPDTSAVAAGMDLRLPAVGSVAVASEVDVAAPPAPQVLTVEAGDTLARIARRAYGDAARWPAIWDANVGRDLGAGAQLTHPDRIEVGWQLVVPDAPVATPVAEHVVVGGDTLWDICAQHYGREDPALVELVFQANRGTTGLEGEGLHDPDLIHPGMRLELPTDLAAASPEASLEPAPEPTPPLPADAPAGPPAGTVPPIEGGEAPVDAPIVATADGSAAPSGALDAGTSDVRSPPPATLTPVPTGVTPGPPPALTPAPSDTESTPIDPAPPPASITPVPADLAPPPASLTPPAPSGEPPAPAPAPAPAPVPAQLTPVPPAQPSSASPSVAAKGPAPTPVDRLGGEIELERRGLERHQLALATLLATGAVTVIDARRRRRLQQMTATDVLPLPDPDLAATDAALRAGADPSGLARLDLALRALMGALADRTAPRPRPEAVIRHANGRIEVHLDAIADQPPPPWIADGPRVWVLAPSVSMDALAATATATASTGAPPPCPALVMLGRTGGSEVYLDLEAVGILHLDGTPAEVLALARALVAGVAVSPFAEVATIITTGLDVHGLVQEVRVDSAPGVDAALRTARAATAPVLGALGDHAPTTFDLRAGGGHEPWEPSVVLIVGTPLDGEQVAELGALAGQGGQGLAVVTDHPVGTSRWRAGLDDDGRWRLDPLGISLEPTRLAAAELANLAALLHEARVEPVAAPTPDPATIADDVAYVDAPWAVQVRVLGPVDVINREGAVGRPEKSKALELLVWLVQHRAGSTRTLARTAMWETDVRDATFANVVSDARRTLARLAEAPAGEDWITRTNGDRLPLHPLVVTDADLVRARLDHARRQSDDAAIDTLRDALALVRGAPYSGTSYLWPDGEGLPSNLTLLVIATASELATRALRLGDVATVFEATSQSLSVLPGHDELVCLRMQAHAFAGDLAGVRHEYEAYERVIVSDPWGDATPSAKVVDWRSRLLRGELIR